MSTRNDKLAELATKLLESLGALQGSVPRAAGSSDSPRDDAMLLLRTKILPELRAARGLPVFIGVQGGTNVGKSTVFNALCGHILSPAIVQASATKHPLIFAHERHRKRLLGAEAFPGLDCRELEDPRELLADAQRTELVYLRFHADDARAEIALIDSPDFDGSLIGNAAAARLVAAISDVTIFVTTAQKYRDRVLVEHLAQLIALKASVVVVFNMLDEEIVFRTLADDLRTALGDAAGGARIHRLPRVSGAHPEETLGSPLATALAEFLGACKQEIVKPLLVRRAFARAADLARDVVRLSQREVEIKRRYEKIAQAELEAALADYRDTFQLALPEETLAVRRILHATELWPRLEIAEELRKSSRVLDFVAGSIRRASDMLRLLFLRVMRRDEGVFEEPAAAREYAKGRDDADFHQILRIALGLRQKLDTFFRDFERSSALAAGALESRFTGDAARLFPSRLREEFDRQTEAMRAESGAGVHERVSNWLDSHRLASGALALGSIAFKLSCAVVLAWCLPPDGVFNAINWIYFVAGYLLGAYAIALIAALSIRRKARFRKAREAAARAVLENSLTRPLAMLCDELVREAELRRVESLAQEVSVALEEGSEAGRAR